MRTYGNIMNDFKQKLEESENAATFTTYDHRNLNSKASKLEVKLLELWDEEPFQEQTTRKRIPERNVKAVTLQFPNKMPIQGTTLKNMH
jgi:hypothetical protein